MRLANLTSCIRFKSQPDIAFWRRHCYEFALASSVMFISWDCEMTKQISVLFGSIVYVIWKSVSESSDIYKRQNETGCSLTVYHRTTLDGGCRRYFPTGAHHGWMSIDSIVH